MFLSGCVCVCVCVCLRVCESVCMCAQMKHVCAPVELKSRKVKCHLLLIIQRANKGVQKGRSNRALMQGERVYLNIHYFMQTNIDENAMRFDPQASSKWGSAVFVFLFSAFNMSFKHLQSEEAIPDCIFINNNDCYFDYGKLYYNPTMFVLK